MEQETFGFAKPEPVTLDIKIMPDESINETLQAYFRLPHRHILTFENDEFVIHGKPIGYLPRQFGDCMYAIEPWCVMDQVHTHLLWNDEDVPYRCCLYAGDDDDELMTVDRLLEGLPLITYLRIESREV